MRAFEDVLGELPALLGGSPEPQVPEGLLSRMVQQESGGNPLAVSPKGARGLLQTMPGTETDPGFGVAPLDPRKDPTQERYRLGQDYMGAMLKRYGGNVEHAIAAYNWGPGNADKWIKRGADPDKLPAETQSYIRNITGDQPEARSNEKYQEAGSFDDVLAELPSLFGGGAAPASTVQSPNATSSSGLLGGILQTEHQNAYFGRYA